jgi:hypothetical protein
MINNILGKEKFDACYGENIAIGYCMKMGSSTLDSFAKGYQHYELGELESNSLSLGEIDILNNNTHNIVLIRDVFDKWLSGMYQEMLQPTNLSSDLLHLLKTGYWENQSIIESLDSDDSQRVKHTKKFINSMVKLYEWNGATDLNWMIGGHARFWMWNNSQQDHDSIYSYLGLLSYTNLDNYYFLELKDLSNPKFKTWLGEQDSSWKAGNFEHINKSFPSIKPQFEKFWDEYNEQKICKDSLLVSPYSNILHHNDKVTTMSTRIMSTVREAFNVNCDVVDHIRNSHPRYLKF